MRLYDLGEQMNVIAEMLEEDPDNPDLTAMLDGLELAFDEKAESIVKLVRSKTSHSKAITDEMEKLKNRAAKLDKEAEWLESYIESQMKLLNKDKVNSTLFTISLVKNNPSVKVDEALLPKKYYRIVPATKAVDKRTLAELLKNGEKIKGAWFEQSKSLRIK